MWVKVWRDSSAMAGRPHYAQYREEVELKEIINYYNETIQGDGFHYLKWERIETPPKEWLQKQLDRHTEILKDLYTNYKKDKDDLEKIIEEYKILMRDT